MVPLVRFPESFCFDNLQINLFMKKLLFVGPKEHEKTGSSRFILDLLSTEYTVEHCRVHVVKGSKEHGLTAYASDHYDILVSWQVMLTPKDLMILSYQRGIFFPMYDGCPSPFKTEKWLVYKNFKIISFSKKLYKDLFRIGLDLEYVQYFPKPERFDSYGDPRGIYLWNRRKDIGLDCLLTTTKNLSIEKIHVHRAPDSDQDWESMAGQRSHASISTSEWYDDKREMMTDVCRYAYYMAPRRREGIGMSFLEAMASGRCVIAPNDSTMNEYIVDGVNGCLYDWCKPKAVYVQDVRSLQKAALEYIQTGYEEWLVKSNKILLWLNIQPNFKRGRFAVWLLLRFIRSPITVFKRLAFGS